MGQDLNKDKSNDPRKSGQSGVDNKQSGGVSQDKARKEGFDRNSRDQKPGAPRK